jgi:hypothetical protein
MRAVHVIFFYVQYSALYFGSAVGYVVLATSSGCIYLVIVLVEEVSLDIENGYYVSSILNLRSS